MRDGGASGEQADPVAPPRRKQVLYVTPEIADYVKVGGLGEVSAALPRALRPHCDMRVLIPGYRELLRQGSALRVVARLPACAALPACDIAQLATADGLVIYAVLCAALYDRPGGPYGDAQGNDWPDNDTRFARLCLAAAELTEGADRDWQPDALHLNDWPTALATATSRGAASRLRRSSPSTISPTRACSTPAGWRHWRSRRQLSASTGSSSTASCPSSRPASTTRRTSPPSAPPMRGRSRPRSSAAASTGCCACAPRRGASAASSTASTAAGTRSATRT